MVNRISLASVEVEDICEWAESHIIIPPTEARPGALSLASYQKEPLRAYADPNCQQVTMMISSQSGKTLLMQCMMSYSMDVKPGPMMLAAPRDDDNKTFLATKFEPMVETSESIRSKLLTKKGQTGTFPAGTIFFLGGYLVMGHSGSPASLRGKTCRNVFGDEIDSFQSSPDAKNPVNMLKQRTTTFGPTATSVFLSTPTEEGESIIEAEYFKGDQREFYTICLACSFEESWNWDKNVVVDEVAGTANLVCSSCGVIVTENDRVRMIQAGRWIAKRPFRGHASFRMSQLTSIMTTFANTTRCFFEYDSQTFKTQILAETYSSKILDALEVEDLERFGEEEPPREEVDAIVVGVDIQKNRLEYSIVHFWNGDLETGEAPLIWVAEHSMEQIRMNDEDSAWEKLSEALRPLAPDMVYVDVGYRPEETSDQIRRHLRWLLRRERIKPIRGRTAASFGDLLNHSKRGDMQWVSVDQAKVMFRDMVEVGQIRFNPRRVPPDYLDQLASERLIEEESRSGIKKLKWVKMAGRRNEALDCFVYALAARYNEALGWNYRRRRKWRDFSRF